MFTGIVTDVGKVRHIEKRGDTHVVIATNYDVAAVEIGASIACSGVCLTVVDKGSAKDRWFAVTASAETLSKTNMGAVEGGRPRQSRAAACASATRLGGHIVTGHVDGVAEIVRVVPEGESMRMTFQAPAALARFIAPKGRSRWTAFR